MSNPIGQSEDPVVDIKAEAIEAKPEVKEAMEYSWSATMKQVDSEISSLEGAPMSLAHVIAYEAHVTVNSVLPMVTAALALLGLGLPLYVYAKASIDTLLESDFVPDAELLTKLQLCPSNAGDDCLDPRFTMTYGVQEQMGQVYADFLPRVPGYLTTTMVWVPTIFFIVITLNMMVAGPLAVQDGVQQNYTDVWATFRSFWHYMLIGWFPFAGSQTLKAMGMISSKAGSFVTFVSMCVTWYVVYRKFRSTGAEPRAVKGYIITALGTGLVAIIVNQFISKRVTSEAGFIVIWVLWTVIGEMFMAYFRCQCRNVDLTKCDPHTVPLLSVQGGLTINCGKRIPLLCLFSINTIIIMNVVSFFVEVTNRITILGRDRMIDRCIRRLSAEEAEAWKDTLHRQIYIHNEMIQEILELIAPVPIAVLLYLIQYSPSGAPVLIGPLALNTVLQVLQEFLADAVAIHYGFKYQKKFYRVAAKSLFSVERYKYILVIITAITYGVHGLFFYTYLRVGKLPTGEFVTLI